MAQEQIPKQREEEEEVQDPGADAGGEGATATQERLEKIGEDVDTILDEIDDVLEENAEDFVRAYVQKGGQ
ncbi:MULTISPECIES: ubiquitin-like protein Pup [Thermocrispum]|jgi:ubiquitin-like protein Pup|uniref:Prokaryotic ubiquitin-like protein Pup n=1 Tax=Thermocrispum agreste TaxID=37925 RepID=A0A2W4LL88_9PSEU|nr:MULTISPECIES: ubiquitin-like protein Pup [Thermocrispum]PZM98473.1 MAG: ubiquitin-like protein Pup [Thermocrispum agreste]